MASLSMRMLQNQINELKEEIASIKCNSRINIISKKLGVGDTFSLAGLEWKILDITEKGYICLAEKLEDDMKFDASCNNWESSDLRNYLNTKLFKKLADEIGEESIISFERDLLSLDGQTEYGKCEDKVSLLNLDEYRKYRSLISNANYWWWLITPDSTKCNDDSKWVTVVSPSGVISNYNCNNYGGVRPFCIFSSSIFESEE